MMISVDVNGKSYEVEVEKGTNGSLRVSFEGKSYPVAAQILPDGGVSMMIQGRSLTACRIGNALYLEGTQYDVRTEDPLRKALVKSTGFGNNNGAVSADMPGNVKQLLVEEGTEVNAGDGVIVLEAMKMENELDAPKAGRIKKIHVSEGQTVEAGTLLFEVE